MNYAKENALYKEKEMKEHKELLKIKPIFKEVIWGGSKLASAWHYSIPSNTTGECWAVAAHKNGDGEVIGSSYTGRTLSDLWKNEKALFGNADGEVFPLLVKIIDAKSDLSIQVHPDDAYAGEHENGSLGKTECWYILDCEEGASIVAGHNAKTREELEGMIREGKWNDLIREVPVKKGSFIQIEPGTVHAIKGGLMILETQQNSDITYRVYDYDRLQNGVPRQLHVQQSIDVITVPSGSASQLVKDMSGLPENVMNEMISCPYYTVWKMNVNGEMKFEQDKNFMILSIIEGKGFLNGQSVIKGDHFILPYKYGEVVLEGAMEVIASAV